MKHILTEIERSSQELLRWAEEHPKCTLKELEEEIQKCKTCAREQLLEAAVAQVLRTAQARCSYREAEEARQRLAGQSAPRSVIHGLTEKYGERLVKQPREEAEQLWTTRGSAPCSGEGQKQVGGISLDRVMVWVNREVKAGSCFDFGAGKDGNVEARNFGY